MPKAKKSKAEFVRWMGPLLDALRELGDSGTPKEVSDLIADKLQLPDEKREELMESGTPRFHNQVCWARQYLVWEGLLSSEKRGVWKLTEKGKQTRLTVEQGHEIFRKWVAIHSEARAAKQGRARNTPPKKKAKTALPPEPEDPGEEDGYRAELLSVLKNLSPAGFENLSKYILRVFGFEKLIVTPTGKDDGIDGFGVLQVNPFVSFKVIFQCKRYKGTVARAHVGDLRNAMIGRADKGIMITTGIFSEDAKREATRDGAPPIELIDGQELIELLVKERIGLREKLTFEIDYDFFKPYMPTLDFEGRTSNGNGESGTNVELS